MPIPFPIRRAAWAPLALVVSVSVAAQATIRVPADQPTIQDGIAAAVDGDTVLVAPGTYVEQVDFLGKAVAVRSEAGAAATRIDSQGLDEWLDFPSGSVVRFVNGEGAGSVLEGFTITGASDPSGFSGGHVGVYCDGLAPTIRRCVITGNQGGPGAGLWGNARVEDCTISDNSALPYHPGGGVYGAPTLVRCRVSGNQSGDRGGGVLATAGCVVLDGVLVDNVAGNGFDGYSGGGVFGPAVLEGCVLARNTAHHWLSGGPLDEIGSAVDGVLELRRCTLVDNRIGNSAGFPVRPGGAVRGDPLIVDSIVWDNEDASFSASSAPTVRFSDVDGGAAGVGTLDLDPLLRDAAAGDYSLTLGSPCVDTGDPASPPDPDATRADLGALFFHQFPAAATERNGSGVNPLCYTSPSTPVLGTVWLGRVDVAPTGLPALLSVVVFYERPSAPIPLPFGELLLDPTSRRLWTSVAAPVNGIAAHLVALPSDNALSGTALASQALVLGGGAVLGNAIDLVLGL